jgi:3-phenylpropionate/trans-cinnamate dioxygenase ferredoxin reductase subunit
MTQHGMVIIGAGLAGAKAVETLRTEGYDGPVFLIGDEQENPYERPGLSKGYLLGTASRGSLDVHDTTWYAENAVDLRTAERVTALDLAAHEVVLADGTRLRFDAAMIATGSSPRPLTVPGAGLSGVLYLRRLADSDRLRASLTTDQRHVVVVGGGWIGLEVAAAAVALGHNVTVVEPQPMVLRAALGDELGAVFADHHRRHGVHLLLNTGVVELRGHDGEVSAVVTTNGDVLPADVVVVGVGVTPNVELAQRAGLTVDNGIVTDEFLRTSHPDVVAAGDVANAFHPFLQRQLRVEHWANARNSGPAAALSMLGQHEAYDRIPYFYTDQYDLGMEYSGDVGPAGHDRVVFRGDPESGSFIAFWLREARVVAGMNVNVWDVTEPIEALIRSSEPLDLSALADPDVPLDELVPHADMI